MACEFYGIWVAYPLIFKDVLTEISEICIIGFQIFLNGHAALVQGVVLEIFILILYLKIGICEIFLIISY